MTMQPPAKFVTGRIMGNASEPIADPTSEMSQTPETDAVFAQHKNIAWVDEWKCAQALLELARSLETRLRAAEEDVAIQKDRADRWVKAARDLARLLGLPDDESRASTQDWRFICEQSAHIVSLEAELERVRKDATLKVYQMCDKHKGASYFTLPSFAMGGTAALAIPVCPICERDAQSAARGKGE